MNASWVVYVLVVGALLVAGANMLEIAARRARLATRWIWVASLLLLVTLAASAPFRGRAPERSSHTVQGLPIVATSTVAKSATLVVGWSKVSGEFTQLQRSAMSAVSRAVPDGYAQVFAVAWFAGTVAIVTLLTVVHVMMRRRRVHWPRTDLHGAPVRITPDIGPAVVGFTEPEIVVPGWLLERSIDEQRLAIAHEREHVAARDNVLLAGSWCVVALMPWHPAAWWMLSRTRLAIELDCDARVLRRGVAARSYGQLLIDIADHCSGQRELALALADHTSHLERRLLAMKRPNIRFGRTRATILGVIGACALLVACESALPTSAEVQKADVATLENKVVLSKLMLDHAGPTAYVVDGKAVSEETAHALKAGDIVSMNIIGGDGKKVLVTTKIGANAYREKQVNEELATGRVHTMEGKLYTTADDKKGLVLTKANNKEFDGIVMIDGVRASNGDLDRMKTLRDRIESIEVIKGEAALRASSDPAAANGIISIRTKKP